MKDIIADFHRKREYNMAFNKIFGFTLYRLLDPIFGFDIIKFDKMIQSIHGNYEDGETSLNDFIKLKFGEDAVKLIDKLIE